MMAPKKHKISFCITCKGRLHHLQQTLRANMDNNADYPNVEFAVLDYDSQDGLENWIKENFQAEMDSGKLRYGKYEAAPHFKMSHAKNMAHRLGTGDILCNLDADNITAPGFATWLNKKFSKDPDIYVRPDCGLQYPPNNSQRGLRGRIAVHRDRYLQVHGYDETFSKWGGDDSNFVDRLCNAGVKNVPFPRHMYGDVITHSDEERIENLAPNDQDKSANLLEKRGLFCTFIKKLDKIKHSRKGVPPLANSNGEFGCGKVRVNFTKDIILEPVLDSTSELAGAGHTQTFLRF
jgi:hypothetical protein